MVLEAVEKEEEMKRPKGVIIWSIVVMMYGLIQLFVCFTSSKLSGDFLNPLNILIALSFFLSGGLLLKMKNWARILFVWQMVYFLVVTGRGLAKTASTQFDYLVVYIIFILLPFTLGICYFNTSKIKDLFNE